ncbi:unnamed protein product [marine sediment metagenome]|uniref:Uncharacterized protein n=1 Tax=marine sediment metagenome TaxID=412755 RepID=X0UR99_9ZZZZ
MEATTYQEVQALARMSVWELRDEHLEVFGEETRSYQKEFLRKRIAWRLQALAELARTRHRLMVRPVITPGKAVELTKLTNLG